MQRDISGGLKRVRSAAIHSLILAIGLLFSEPATSGQLISGIASIVDGDTLEIHGVRIRLHGIDAPEAAQTCKRPGGKTWRCGQESALALADRVRRLTLVCQERELDQYGRSIAVCNLGDQEVNSWLVAQGLAVAFRRHSLDYVKEEEAARRAALGLWSSDFEMPWDYRARRWQAASSISPNPDCPIKGNINRRGERIYHTPWGSRSYDKTVIDTEKGERWFCNEREATEAGWRAPYH